MSHPIKNINLSKEVEVLEEIKKEIRKLRKTSCSTPDAVILVLRALRDALQNPKKSNVLKKLIKAVDEMKKTR